MWKEEKSNEYDAERQDNGMGTSGRMVRGGRRHVDRACGEVSRSGRPAQGFGAVYHLEASATGEIVVLRTLTPSREKCGLPSVCDLWKAAELNEREVFDYFGIGFLNHPDMRRLFLRDDWVGSPLR